MAGGRIKKNDQSDPATGRIHKSKELPDNLIRFSFRHWHSTDKFGVDQTNNPADYLSTFLERLKDLSNFTVSEFRTNKDRSLRAHTHDWAKTTEPNGYSSLTKQLRECEPWQFQLSVNEHGRVHGILIDEIFYVVWLDPQHNLYA